MPDLPQKKVGIIACSGEELSEGTVTRLAALQVLEKLRPGDTITICLPLFLAGGAGDRAFARYYPTIAIDGCEKRCAFNGTERYSNRPAASIVVTDLVADQKLDQPAGKRKLDEAGLRVVDVVAQQAVVQVDSLLGRSWSRRDGTFTQPEAAEEQYVATCACGSGIPIQKVMVNGVKITLVALPLIFQVFREAKKTPSEAALNEIMDMLRIYNAIEPGDEPDIRREVAREYQIYWQKYQTANAEADHA